MVVGGFVKHEILKLFRQDMARVRRAILPQATELIHLYRNIVEKWEREESSWHWSTYNRRNKILDDIVKKFKSVTSELDGRLEPECFDHFMNDIPHEIDQFKEKLQEVNDVETKKKDKHKDAMRRKSEIERSMSSSQKITVEVRHLLPRTGTSQDIYKVYGCTTEDTLDMVLIQWMMDYTRTAKLWLRTNPRFYDRVALQKISSIHVCDPLAFSDRLRTAFGETRPIIIDCIMDEYDHPLVIFKQIPEWAFGKLCRFKGPHGGKLVLKATTGHLRDERWYQKRLLNPDDSINISKTQLGARRAPRSLTWVKLLREIERSDSTEHTIWVIETPSTELLNEDGFKLMNPGSYGASTSTLVSSSSAHAPSSDHIDKVANTLSNEFAAQSQSTDTVDSSMSAQETSRAKTARPRGRIADDAKTESRSTSSDSSNRMPRASVPPGPAHEHALAQSALASQTSGNDNPTVPSGPANIKAPVNTVPSQQSTGPAAVRRMDGPQAPKSSDVARPSPKPEDSPKPLPVAAATPEQSVSRPNKPQKKGWLARAKEFIGLG